VRKTLSEGGDLPPEFSRPDVVAILQDYYQNLEEKVEVKLHGAATGDVKKD
jgi:sulfate adenylyltransferase